MRRIRCNHQRGETSRTNTGARGWRVHADDVFSARGSVARPARGATRARDTRTYTGGRFALPPQPVAETSMAHGGDSGMRSKDSAQHILRAIRESSRYHRLFSHNEAMARRCHALIGRDTAQIQAHAWAPTCPLAEDVAGVRGAAIPAGAVGEGIRGARYSYLPLVRVPPGCTSHIFSNTRAPAHVECAESERCGAYLRG